MGLKLNQTGSFINYLMSNNQTIPKVGAGCTIMHWSDRTAYEVLEVSDDCKRVIISEINYKAVEGAPYGSEMWEETGVSTVKEVLKYRYKNWYKELEDYEGKKYYSKVNVIFGVKQYYYDPCF